MDPNNAQNGITLSGFYVDADTWNVANYQVTQTMYVCDYNNWYAVANMNNSTGDGAVKTYPNVHEDFGSSPLISSFRTISSSFAHTAPHVGIYEFAYDIWLNGVASSGSTEVMIWTDNYNQVPSGSSIETVMFDGQSYDVHKSGSYIAFVETTNVTSGAVNLMSFFDHIISKGWIPSTSTLGAIDYGVELVSTNGMNATFQVNDFSLTTN
jgi:Glycosyl hydrolase family 12